MTSTTSRSKHAFHSLWGHSSTILPSPSHILPHTYEAGDPFYIGDIYEPSRIGQSGELIEEHLLPFKSPVP